MATFCQVKAPSLTKVRCLRGAKKNYLSHLESQGGNITLLIQMQLAYRTLLKTCRVPLAMQQRLQAVVFAKA